MAWHYKKYQGEQSASDPIKYSDAEREATEDRPMARPESGSTLGLPTGKAKSAEEHGTVHRQIDCVVMGNAIRGGRDHQYT